MRRFFIIIGFLLIFSGLAFAQSGIQFNTTSPEMLDVRYRLYDTGDFLTKLLLDTKTGRVWQVLFSLEKGGIRSKFPINTEVLADGENIQNGRFTLYPTSNLWAFILVDQENGKLWQCKLLNKVEPPTSLKWEPIPEVSAQ